MLGVPTAMRVHWVAGFNPNAGALGMAFAPGKCEPKLSPPAGARDLTKDLATLAHVECVDLLICLMENHELRTLQIEALPQAALAAGLCFQPFAMVDMQPPSMALARQAVDLACAALQDGKRVVFQCRGGLGRSGTMAACALVQSGHSPQEAIDRIRTARPGAIETPAQEEFIHTYSR